jgi:site-specific DNA recombinase
MVWNRRSTKDTLHPGKANSRTEWIWAPQPVHEPPVTRDLFDAVTVNARSRQGSRSGSGANSLHPKTKRTYLLRSYVVCDLCGRRMAGVTAPPARTSTANLMPASTETPTGIRTDESTTSIAAKSD